MDHMISQLIETWFVLLVLMVRSFKGCCPGPLHYLSRNETAYNEMLKWRAKPLPTAMQKWIDLMNWQYNNLATMGEARCEFCRVLHQAPKRSSKRPAPTMPASKQRVPIHFPVMPDATLRVGE